jgi:hypothetical protein
LAVAGAGAGGGGGGGGGEPAWCARPPGVLRRVGEVRVKDSGCGALAEAREAGGAVWRAMFSENGLWGSVCTAVLGGVLTARGGGDALERPWKHPWQSAPLDAGEDMAGWWCGERRRACGEALQRVARARSGRARCDLAAEAAAAYAAQARGGVALLRNRYDVLQPADVGEVVHAAGGALVARILRRVAADPFGHSIGFPDITLWRAPLCCAFSPSARDLPPPPPPRAGAATAPTQPTQAEATPAPPAPPPADGGAPAFAMVEVKSQHDRMQASQIAWFKELEGAPICVLRVLPVPQPQRCT